MFIGGVKSKLPSNLEKSHPGLRLARTISREPQVKESSVDDDDDDDFDDGQVSAVWRSNKSTTWQFSIVFSSWDQRNLKFTNSDAMKYFVIMILMCPSAKISLFYTKKKKEEKKYISLNLECKNYCSKSWKKAQSERQVYPWHTGAVAQFLSINQIFEF